MKKSWSALNCSNPRNLLFDPFVWPMDLNALKAAVNPPLSAMFSFTVNEPFIVKYVPSTFNFKLI